LNRSTEYIILHVPANNSTCVAAAFHVLSRSINPLLSRTFSGMSMALLGCLLVLDLGCLRPSLCYSGGCSLFRGRQLQDGTGSRLLYMLLLLLLLIDQDDHDQ
jgi:hypothetical protein